MSERILYAPYIDGNIPAFEYSRVVIPFLMNPAVAPAQVNGFKVKIINLSTPDSKAVVITTKKGAFDAESACANGEVILVADTVDSMSVFTSGDSYKIQLAYYAEPTDEPVWSSVGVGRCIGSPTVSIKSLQTVIANENITNYVGQYISQYISEPVYSYCFTLIQQDTQEVIQTSGIKTHNSSADTVTGSSRIGQDDFYISSDLDKDKYYILSYEITTVNGYNKKVSYIIKGNAQLEEGFNCAVNVKLNREYGYVEISLNKTAENIRLAKLALQRREAQGTKWDTLIEILMSNRTEEDWSKYIWRDFSVEQGKSYIYSIVEFATDESYQVRRYAERTNLSKEILVDFEDIILSDDERVLRVAFNPKVSSFKETIQEQKIDTLGSKYPFFFRNGQIRYAEIPVSGLVSYQLDPEGLFAAAPQKTWQDSGPAGSGQGVQGYDSIYTDERNFKLKVLNWLNNGKPKLLRTPVEGNYIVRLMDISFSPEDKLGRMLHTFSATGYEIADANDYEALKENRVVNCEVEGMKEGIIYGNNEY